MAWNVDEMLQNGELELRAWDRQPPGGQRVTARPGVLAIHVPTGCAFISLSERSQLANRENALVQLEVLVRLIGG